MAILITASGGIFLYCVLVLLFGESAEKKYRMKTRIRRLNAEPEKILSRHVPEYDKSFTERLIKPLAGKLTGMLSSVFPFRTAENPAQEKQKRMLQQAGWTISSEEYTAIQLIVMIAAGLLGLILGLISRKKPGALLLYAFVGAFGAYTVLRYVCTATGTSRKNAMEKQLPDALDLLSVSVTAGLGFERALLHLVETMEGPLIDEFAVTCREMSLGRPRREALALLAERCGVEDLTTVTGSLIQAGQLGIPISNVLQSQSAAIRRTRRNKVKEKAAKVSTKMLLPMIGLIFPVLLIVLLGPSVITIIEEFS